MLGLKLNHVSKRGPRRQQIISTNGFSPWVSRFHSQSVGIFCWPNFVTGQFYLMCIKGIDLARNGNSGCANEILGCAKCHFWWKSPWKWRIRVILWCALSTIARAKHGWLANTMIKSIWNSHQHIQKLSWSSEMFTTSRILIGLFDMPWNLGKYKTLGQGSNPELELEIQRHMKFTSTYTEIRSGDYA